MKILQICNRIPYPPRDGGAIGIYNFTKAYYELGNEVTMLAMNTSKHFISPDSLPEDFLKLAELHAVFIDNAIKPLDALKFLLKGKSYHVERFISKEFEEKLISILEKKRFDIIHLDGLYVSSYIETIRHHSKAKVVYRAHNVEYLIWKRLAENAPLGPKKWYLNILAKQLKEYEQRQLNKFDLIVAITHQDQSVIQQMNCKAPLLVSPAGINLEEFIPDFSKVEFPSLFHIGGLDWMPNQEALLWFLKNVWRKINRHYPRLKFYIAGRKIPGWISRLKYANVIILGEVENAVDFINSKAIMIVPLLSGGGMRIKIIEGMALGKTIISTSIGAEGISYSHGKNILIANNPKEFVKYISQCVDDKKYSQRIGIAGIDLVKENYDNKKVVAALLDYYKSELC